MRLVQVSVFSNLNQIECCQLNGILQQQSAAFDTPPQHGNSNSSNNNPTNHPFEFPIFHSTQLLCVYLFGIAGMAGTNWDWFSWLVGAIQFSIKQFPTTLLSLHRFIEIGSENIHKS